MIEYNRMSKQLIMEIMTVKMESGRMSQNEILGDLTEVMAECNLMSRELIMEEMAKTLANYDRTARMKAKFGYYKDQTTFNHNSTQKLHERSMKDIICTSSEKNNKSDSLPKSVDYREDGIVTGVRSQGNCGSCWAFSAAGALEGQLARKTGQLLELSPQNLVDCVLDKGCDGGYMGLAYKYVTDNGGLNSEEDYPYVGKKQKCRFKPSAVAAQCKGFKMIPKGDEDALAEALNDVGPLSVVLNVGDKTFDFYKTGIYYNPECDENQQSHAMLLVGYGETAKGEKYWIVKNSWGEHWGEKGYIRIARDCDNHCGIASQASYPLM
ncbi:cathepsin L1-like [Anabas testudineus]|uniref:cathepsin L1-like n=1 Tax=Anabas testudineus TaxID=64144 RepID=UPI000E45485F|nr:cathepsin L1-like [Anabas testudineus]